VTAAEAAWLPFDHLLLRNFPLLNASVFAVALVWLHVAFLALYV